MIIYQTQNPIQWNSFKYHSDDVRAKNILLIGMATGTLVGLLMTVITHIPLGSTSDGSKITVMYHWSGLLSVVIGIPLVSAFGVKKIAVDFWDCEPGLKHLIPVAYLTFLIPIFGSAFGAANSDLDTLATIILLGSIGGLFWSTPFALWNFYKAPGAEEQE